MDNAKHTPDLLPCPLCGGKPYLVNVAMVGCTYVVCTNCRLQTDDGSADRVVAHWNTRATPAREAADDMLEALEWLLRCVPTGTVECRGDKCREPWCISCWGEVDAEAAVDAAALRTIKARTLIARAKGGL